VKEELGDGSLLSLNYLSTANIFVREPKSHAVHNPHTIDPEIERRIIELRREHPDWGKKRIAQWIWKEHYIRKYLGLPMFIKRRKVTAEDVIKRDAGREGMEGCGGIDDGSGRGG